MSGLQFSQSGRTRVMYISCHAGTSHVMPEVLTSIPVMRWVGSPCALVRSSGRSRRKKLKELPSLKLTFVDQAEGAVALPFSRGEVAHPLLTTDGRGRQCRG